MRSRSALPLAWYLVAFTAYGQPSRREIHLQTVSKSCIIRDVTSLRAVGLSAIASWDKREDKYGDLHALRLSAGVGISVSCFQVGLTSYECGNVGLSTPFRLGTGGDSKAEANGEWVFIFVTQKLETSLGLIKFSCRLCMCKCLE